MSRFINTELKSDSESSDSDLDSEEIGAKVDNELMEKLKSDSILNKTFYSYIFVDFKQVFIPIFLKGFFFSQALLGLKIHKHFNQFN